MRNSDVWTLGPLSVESDDVLAVSYDAGDGRGRLLPQFDAGPPRQRVKVFTSLREAGKRDPLVTLEVSGEPARSAWETFTRLAGAGPAALDFVPCGDRWYVRASHVRLVNRVDNEHYAVLMSPPDRERAGGWVTRIVLEWSAGLLALDAALRQRGRGGLPSAG